MLRSAPVTVCTSRRDCGTVDYINLPSLTPSLDSLPPLSLNRALAPIPPESPRMKLNPWYLVAPIPVALMAANGPFGAQLLVLGVTIGIFFGTLALGRPTPGNATTTNH